MAKSKDHPWAFKARFRRGAFGWKSEPALTRVRQAVVEIRKVSKAQPLIAAEGAVVFLERVSPALEQVDSSSGAIGTAVSSAIADLVPVIAGAPAAKGVRGAWLDRLFEAFQQDEIPYIGQLAELWGELCGSAEVASAWADRLLDPTRAALHPQKGQTGYFKGSSACLSALFKARRFEEIVELVHDETMGSYRLWGVRALVEMGRKAEALLFAEASRGRWSSDPQIDSLCEEILISSGMVDEAYERYGLRANRGGTYLATFRAVARRYPHKAAADILADLVKTTPGDEGKWFAAAKDAGLYPEALDLAGRTPCDPRTLTRAARDYAATEPAFALGAGLLALHWLARGYGYEVTALDIWGAYRATVEAAAGGGAAADVKERIRKIITGAGPTAVFVAQVLGSELGPRPEGRSSVGPAGG